MDRESLTLRAASDWKSYVLPEPKPAPAPEADAGPGFLDVARCAISCWLSGSSFERVDSSRDAFVCICSKREPVAGGLWRWR